MKKPIKKQKANPSKQLILVMAVICGILLAAKNIKAVYLPYQSQPFELCFIGAFIILNTIVFILHKTKIKSFHRPSIIFLEIVEYGITILGFVSNVINPESSGTSLALYSTSWVVSRLYLILSVAGSMVLFNCLLESINDDSDDGHNDPVPNPTKNAQVA